MPPPAHSRPEPLLILCGGHSRRMGSPKPLLRYGGQTLLARLMTHTDPARPVWLAAADKRYADSGRAEYLPDAQAGQAGPLSAILPALQQAKRQGWGGLYVMACDSLLLPEQLTALLAQQQHSAEWAAGITALADDEEQGQIHPLLAHWSCRLAGPLAAAVARDERKVMAWLAAQAHRRVAMPPHWQALSNFNTGADFERACAMADGLTLI
ncbi:molybdopterin-guanine dinucleotide biosynthesis protein A [Neisseria sp. HSC-16F19]|nr:molybdenum cofactor guanylyltransferase [Neisseria sp. HSC-16F19]MCP2039788.1 molybdopterin-guanine dinucleotide biosynthesis protein A [Neisseria sp. HSC-16F19]